MAKKYKSKISAAVHESISDLHEIGLVDKRTMREFDERCLTRAQPLSPREFKNCGSARA